MRSTGFLSIGCGVALALSVILANGAQGASNVAFTVSLGGDNHAADWKASPRVRTKYSGDSEADDQYFYIGEVVPWAVKVRVTGAHSYPGHPSDGKVTYGVANVVFNLELHEGSETGPLATTVQFKSSINDGLNGDPQRNAAFALGFDFLGIPGRLIDNVDNFGPRLEPIFTYPAAPPGQLIGQGAGYKEWNRTGDGSVVTMPGVGQGAGEMPDGAGGYTNGLGYGPIAEGQIDFAGLTPGTYVLKVIPGNGNNVLRGDMAMADPTNRPAFAVAANGTTGDTITFTVGTTPICRGIQGRYVYYNNCKWDGNTVGITANDMNAIDFSKQPLLPGHTSTAANYSAYIKGITGIAIDCCHFNRVPELYNDIYFTIGDGSATDPYSWFDTPTADPEIQLFPGAGVNGSDRLMIAWPDGAIPNKQWVLVQLWVGDGSLGLTEDDYFMFGNSVGENNGDRIVNATDWANTKAHFGGPNSAPVDSPYDYNKDKVVNATDTALCKSSFDGPSTRIKQITW